MTQRRILELARMAIIESLAESSSKMLPFELEEIEGMLSKVATTTYEQCYAVMGEHRRFCSSRYETKEEAEKHIPTDNNDKYRVVKATFTHDGHWITYEEV